MDVSDCLTLLGRETVDASFALAATGFIASNLKQHSYEWLALSGLLLDEGGNLAAP